MLRTLGRFSKDRWGGFAVKTALAAPVFIFAMASAIEYSRAHSARVALRNAIDTATLSGTRMLALDPASSDADIAALVQRQLQASEAMRAAGMSCNPAGVTIDRVNVSVATSITCSMDTILPTSLAKFDFNKSAQSEMNFDSLDVAMMLDVSGSMGGQKLRDLQNAVKDAIDVFLVNSRSNVRIALAPYSTAVNAGDYAIPATDEDVWVRVRNNGRLQRRTPGNGTQFNCVTERNNSSGNAFNDAPPNTEFLRRDAPKNGYRYNRLSFACNPAEILPLTDNRSELFDRVDSFIADGRTAGHLGIAWSWYLISPRWRSFWPIDSRPLATGDGRKAVIIMTDGLFNEPYVNANGNSAAQSLRLCDEMKRQGVLVFSVGFRAPNGVKPTLRDCATTPSYFFDSNSRTQLQDAYKSIAEELSTHILVQ